MPTPETVLNKPLSGLDVRRIILAKLESQLASDSRLAEFMAFPAFQFRLDYAIVLAGAVEPHDKLEHALTGVAGDASTITDDPNRPSTVATGHVEQGVMPPNQARVDAGLGVPVLTRDEKGREIEREVKYAPERARQVTGQ